MREPDYGLLENYKELGIGILEFAIDDYISTIKSLCTYYKKLDKCFEELFKAQKHHERMGDVILAIYHRIQNIKDIETFLSGSWVQQLTTLDVDAVFRETKRKLRKKGYRVGLMGLTVKTDEKGVKIFAKEHEGTYGKFTSYSIGVSSKASDGNGWNNGYIQCRFRKGVNLADKTKIKINNSFFCVNKSGDKSYTYLMITDFDILEMPDSAAGDADGFIKIPETDDEPFL